MNEASVKVAEAWRAFSGEERVKYERRANEINKGLEKNFLQDVQRQRNILAQKQRNARLHGSPSFGRIASVSSVRGASGARPLPSGISISRINNEIPNLQIRRGMGVRPVVLGRGGGMMRGGAPQRFQPAKRARSSPSRGPTDFASVDHHGFGPAALIGKSNDCFA